MYNKLFTKILDSSIWLQDDQTIRVWITLLASMDEDGFAPFASPMNLAVRARVSLEDTTRIVAYLEAPDEFSGNPEHEGRRIERSPGGWFVLNAGYYRKIATRIQAREKSAERMRRFRATGGGAPDKFTALRHQALTRDAHSCRYCGQAAHEVDHVLPVSRGGSDAIDNLVAACMRCNRAKGKRTPEEAGMEIMPIQAENRRVTQENRSVTERDGSLLHQKHMQKQDQIQKHTSIAREKTARSMRDGFDAFWLQYPKKAARQAALKAWSRIAASVPTADIMAGLDRATRSEQWAKDGGQFVPHAATWLNGGRWTDDLPAAAGSVPVPAAAQPQRVDPCFGMPVPFTKGGAVWWRWYDWIVHQYSGGQISDAEFDEVQAKWDAFKQGQQP